MSGLFRVGTSGWNYKHWRERFYPRDLPVKRWFQFYAERFDTVEINNTFYRWATPEVFESWRAQAPSGFVYAVKANRLLTHMKKLTAPEEPLKRLYARAGKLAPHLGPILFQLPPKWACNVERLRSFCHQLRRDVVHVFEFRAGDWLCDEVFETLEQCGVGVCIHDLIERHPKWTTGPVSYVRFHGAAGKYQGAYSREQLRRWADWMRAAATPERPIFAYFNNDIDGHAVQNARTLRELLER